MQGRSLRPFFSTKKKTYQSSCCGGSNVPLLECLLYVLLHGMLLGKWEGVYSAMRRSCPGNQFYGAVVGTMRCKPLALFLVSGGPDTLEECLAVCWVQDSPRRWRQHRAERWQANGYGSGWTTEWSSCPCMLFVGYVASSREGPVWWGAELWW